MEGERPESVECKECRTDVLVPERGRIPVWCAGCRPSSRRTPRAARVCRRCGAPFETRCSTRIYCSRTCGEIARGQRREAPLPEVRCALPECGAGFQPIHDYQRCCSEKHGKVLYNRESRADGRQKPALWSDRRRDNYHRRRAAKKCAETGRPVRLAEIAARDSWLCHLCNGMVDSDLVWPHPQSPSLDHVVPLTPRAGEPRGAHDPANVRLAHLRCNVSKGNRPGGEQLLVVG